MIGGARDTVLSLHYDLFNGLVATVRGGVRLLLGDDAELCEEAALIDPILSQIAAVSSAESHRSIFVRRIPRS